MNDNNNLNNQNATNNTQEENNNQPLGYMNPTMYAGGGEYQNQLNFQTENKNTEAKKDIGKWPIVIAVILTVFVSIIGLLYYEAKDKDNKVETASKFANKKILVAYYSREGENYGANLGEKVTIDKGYTEILSEKIADYVGADLYRIVPSVPYPEDLDELYIQSRKELNNDYYPEIANKVNIKDYDVVFIGYPNWHQTYPQIIKTFVRDNVALRYKYVIPFVTHAGAGDSGTYKTLNKLIDGDSTKFLDGFNINGTKVKTSDDKIKEWLTRLGFEIKK